MAGGCLFFLRSLATAEVETVPANTAKTHNANFFIYLSIERRGIAARNHSAAQRDPNGCAVVKKIQSCTGDTPSGGRCGTRCLDFLSDTWSRLGSELT